MACIQFWGGIAFVGIALFIFFLYAWSFFRRDGSFAQRLVPCEPRKPVPWNGWELLFFFAVWIFIIPVSGSLFRELQLGTHIQERALEPEQRQELRKVHGIAQLVVQGRDDIRVFLVVFFVGVIIVPIGEEFLFRLLLQGYLEKQESRLRKLLRFFLPYFAIRGLSSVCCTAAVFALIHWRSTAEVHSFQSLFDGLLGLMAGHLVVFAVITTYLFAVCRASLHDLGIDGRRIFRDSLLGLCAAAFLLPPIYFLNYGLAILVGDPGFTLDPIPLFFFAAGLGILYFRTHRILPAIVLHGVFNGVAVANAYVCAYVLF